MKGRGEGGRAGGTGRVGRDREGREGDGGRGSGVGVGGGEGRLRNPLQHPCAISSRVPTQARCQIPFREPINNSKGQDYTYMYM